jgi:hypothetical protein
MASRISCRWSFIFLTNFVNIFVSTALHAWLTQSECPNLSSSHPYHHVNTDVHVLARFTRQLNTTVLTVLLAERPHASRMLATGV